MEYDESVIEARLTALPKPARVLFAVACAERLMPLFASYCGTTPTTEFAAARGALDDAWSATGDEAKITVELRDSVSKVEALIPDEEAEGAVFPGVAFAENAVASVAYTLRTWLCDTPRDAMWAGRQLYETADLVVQLTVSAGTKEQGGNTASPQATEQATRWILTLLDSVKRVTPAKLRAEAEADGRSLLQLSGLSA
jgi:uncharacterized protein YjaG (DUF416 family)